MPEPTPNRPVPTNGVSSRELYARQSEVQAPPTAPAPQHAPPPQVIYVYQQAPPQTIIVRDKPGFSIVRVICLLILIAIIAFCIL